MMKRHTPPTLNSAQFPLRTVPLRLTELAAPPARTPPAESGSGVEGYRGSMRPSAMSSGSDGKTQGSECVIAHEVRIAVG